MPYNRRSSLWSTSNSFSSSAPSTPGTSASSSALAPSPLAAAAAAIACPDIVECDEDSEPRPPSIVIGDAQVDDAPFDPSLSDEMHCRRWEAAARAQAAHELGAGPSASLHDRLARLIGAHHPRARHGPPPATTTGAAGPPEHRRSRFRLRRGSSAEPVPSADAEEPPRELATLVSCTKRPRGLALVPLDVAQARESIVRHPEGFELKEARSTNGGI